MFRTKSVSRGHASHWNVSPLYIIDMTSYGMLGNEMFALFIGNTYIYISNVAQLFDVQNDKSVALSLSLQ